MHREAAVILVGRTAEVPTRRPDEKVLYTVVVVVTHVNALPIVLSIPASRKDGTRHGLQSCRGTVVHFDTTVIGEPHHVCGGGADEEVIKPVAVEIGHGDAAFRFVCRTFTMVGGNGVDTPSVLTGKRTNEVDREGGADLGGCSDLLNGICVEIHPQGVDEGCVSVEDAHIVLTVSNAEQDHFVCG